nr:NAD(P)-binding domain-containing protein [Micrococcus terreus]MDK7702406.1 NAD(P)-binding domain-containing protein [Micrococcus terreus]
MSASAGPQPGVGILGAGRAGTALARALQRAGIPAWIASTRSPTSMRFHLAQYAPRATAVAAEQIGQQTGGSGPGRPDGLSIVVLMVPQEDLDGVDPGWLDGVLLVDATNRWEDEPLPDWFEDSLQAGLSSSEAIAARFSGSTVVKTLNHLSHWDLDGGGQRVQPRLQPVAGDPANMGLEVGGAAAPHFQPHGAPPAACAGHRLRRRPCGLPCGAPDRCARLRPRGAALPARRGHPGARRPGVQPILDRR